MGSLTLFGGATILPLMKGVSRRGRASRGQALVEYLLMTAMLLFLFTGMYKLLQSNLRSYFRGAGQSILKAYY